MNLKAGAGTDEASAKRVSIANQEGEGPYVGMEFESEEAAKKFYDGYARRVGFLMRVDQCRRSEVDKRILSRRFSCNRQGYNAKARDVLGPVKKPRTSIREGCKAMMLVKFDKSGKWVVTRFVQDHTHPFFVSPNCSSSRNSMDSKDRKIQELTAELKHQDQLCEVYGGLLLRLLNYVEEQMEELSRKVEVVVDSVREIENDVQKPSQNLQT